MKLIDELKEYIPYNEQEENDKKQIINFLSNNSDAFLRSNSIAHITSSSWIVNKDFNKVLMIYHNIYDSWSWTGGHADGDEDLLKVAIKEAKEETHIKHIKPLLNSIFSIESLTVDGHIKHDKYVSSHLHLNITYLLVADENDHIEAELNENKAVKWISIDEVTNEVNEKWMNKYVYSKLNEKLRRIKNV